MPTATDGGATSAGPLPSVAHAAQHDPYRNDVWMILLYCALLAVLWAVAALASGHVGFRVLLLADGVVIVPLAAYALLASRPTWWEVVSAGVGGLVLLGVLAAAMYLTRRIDWYALSPAAPR